MAARHLYCYMNDKQIGVLTRDKGRQSFTCSAAWLADEQTRPLSLSMPL
jgi:HipA-like protein